MNEHLHADKTFATLQAQFALLGHALSRTVASDGSTSYYAVRWGMSRHLDSLDAIQIFLKQLGGRA